MKLSDLIAKLEAAAEGSRELDAEIRKAIPFTGEPLGEWRDGYGATWTVYPDDNDGPPPYTTSIDAALTLFSDEAEAIGVLHAVTWQRHIGDTPIKRVPSLICIAALKAQEQTDDR